MPGNSTSGICTSFGCAERDRVLAELNANGIGAGIHYPYPVHLTAAYADLGYPVGSFPVAERVATEILSLPLYPHITAEQQTYVAEVLGSAIARRAVSSDHRIPIPVPDQSTHELQRRPATRATAAVAEATGPKPAERSIAGLAGRGAMWAVLASITMRFASVGITAVLARILSKEDFGVFAVALAVYLVVSSLAELGMGSAIARSPMEPEDIAPTVASISILVSGSLSLLMAAGAPLLASRSVNPTPPSRSGCCRSACC